jgi:hypothetical protein
MDPEQSESVQSDAIGELDGKKDERGDGKKDERGDGKKDERGDGKKDD